MNIHKEIEKQLEYFYQVKKVPNIIFYGNNGSGKKTLLSNFLLKVYSTQENMNKYSMIVDCKLLEPITSSIVFVPFTTSSYPL